MRTLEKIIEQVEAYINENPNATDKEIGLALHLSPRFTKKLILSGLLKWEINPDYKGEDIK